MTFMVLCCDSRMFARGLFVRPAEAGRGKYGVDLEDPVEEELGRTLLFLSVDVFGGWSAMLLVTCTKSQQRTNGLPFGST